MQRSVDILVKYNHLMHFHYVKHICINEEFEILRNLRLFTGFVKFKLDSLTSLLKLHFPHPQNSNHELLSTTE